MFWSFNIMSLNVEGGGCDCWMDWRHLFRLKGMQPCNYSLATCRGDHMEAALFSPLFSPVTNKSRLAIQTLNKITNPFKLEFYRMTFLFFHDRMWRMELQQHSNHIVECHTCLNTCKLWADLGLGASDNLMAAVCQSVPPIHAHPLVLILPLVPWLCQTGGKPYAPEMHLVWYGTSTGIILYPEIIKCLRSWTWPGPCPDTYQVPFCQFCVCISKVGQILYWVRNHSCVFGAHFAHAVIPS